MAAELGHRGKPHPPKPDSSLEPGPQARGLPLAQLLSMSTWKGKPSPGISSGWRVWHVCDNGCQAPGKAASTHQPPSYNKATLGSVGNIPDGTASGEQRVPVNAWAVHYHHPPWPLAALCYMWPGGMSKEGCSGSWALQASLGLPLGCDVHMAQPPCLLPLIGSGCPVHHSPTVSPQYLHTMLQHSCWGHYHGGTNKKPNKTTIFLPGAT